MTKAQKNIIVSAMVEMMKSGEGCTKDNVPKTKELTLKVGFPVIAKLRNDLLPVAELALLGEEVIPDTSEEVVESTPDEPTVEVIEQTVFVGRRVASISSRGRKPDFLGFRSLLYRWWAEEGRFGRKKHHPSMHNSEESCENCSDAQPTAEQEYRVLG